MGTPGLSGNDKTSHFSKNFYQRSDRELSTRLMYKQKKKTGSFCRKNFLMTSILMWFSSHFQGKHFPTTLNKTTYFLMHISISEFFIPLCCRQSGCPILHLLGIQYTIHGYLPILQSNYQHKLRISKEHIILHCIPF